MKMKKFWLVVLGLFFTVNVFSQDSLAVAIQDTIVVVQDSIILNEKPSKWQNFKYDVNTIGGGFVNAFTQPFRWKKDDYMIAGATVAGVSLLYLVDEETSDFFQRQKPGIPHSLSQAGWAFGKPQFSYTLTAGVYFFGLFTDNEKVRETGVLLTTSAAVTGLFQQTMKTITGRARPGTGEGKNQFHLFEGGRAYGSFPSGHTILSTTVIYGLSKQFSNPWVKAGLFTAGLITPMNRLVDGAHWLTDVTLSMVVSVAVVECVDNYLKKNKKYGNTDDELGMLMMKKDKIKWNLSFGANQLGVVGTF